MTRDWDAEPFDEPTSAQDLATTERQERMSARADSEHLAHDDQPSLRELQADGDADWQGRWVR